MAYLDMLQQGLLGAMQNQNNPTAYLRQAEQMRNAMAQQNQQTYAQASQMGKANMAQLANTQDKMMQAGEQAVKQKVAEDAQKEAAVGNLLGLGLNIATGGGLSGLLGGSKGISGAAKTEMDAMKAADITQLEKGLLGSGAISPEIVMKDGLAKAADITSGLPTDFSYRPKKVTSFF